MPDRPAGRQMPQVSGNSSTEEPEASGDITRRRVLQVGTVAVVAAGSLGLDAVRASAAPAVPAWRQRVGSEISFDEDWLFFRGDASGASAPSFDDSSWLKVDVPYDWSIEDLPYATSADGMATAGASLFDYTSGTAPAPGVPTVIGPFDFENSAGGAATGYTVGGFGWYRKHFELPDLRPGPGAADGGQEQPQVELRFDGVYEYVDVWLNDTHLGFHPNGYTPFCYDLTPHLNFRGGNVLAVRVNNSGKNSRWYAGSGIYRHTWLTITGPVRIPTFGVAVTTPVVSARQSVARVEVRATNLGTAASTAQVQVTLLDPSGRPVAAGSAGTRSLAPGVTAAYTVDVPVARTALWSPRSPSLYQARTEVVVGGAVVDSVSTTFGFRTLEWNGTDGFLLNGNPVQVRGACIHANHGPMGAACLAASEYREIEALKAAGFNAIRTAHNPPSPLALDACDRLGMLVWDEFSDMWDKEKNPQDYHLYFPQWWQRDLTSMILRDRNHPSVVIWSLGNEIDDTSKGKRGVEMAALVHSLDRTRPVSQGAAPFITMTDPMYQYVDVADVHYDLPTIDKIALHAAYPAKAMTQSESWSTTLYADRQLAVDHSWFVGSWVWTGIDYMGESGIGSPIYGKSETGLGPFGTGVYPWFQSGSGDLDFIGVRKPQNYWRAVVYGDSPIEMMVQRPAPAGTTQFNDNWSYYDELPGWTWDLPQGQPMPVHVYTSGDQVTLLLNGKIVATNSVTPADQQVSTFTVPWTPGVLTAIATRNGREIGRKIYATTGSPAALRLTSDVPVLTTSRDDLAHVLVEVVDRQGQRVPDSVVGVSFQVEGAGELAAVGNGNPHNIDSFRRPGRYTWHGQALAIIRPAKSPGRVRLTATAPGLQAATLTLPVRPVGPGGFASSRNSRQVTAPRSAGPPGPSG